MIGYPLIAARKSVGECAIRVLYLLLRRDQLCPRPVATLLAMGDQLAAPVEFRIRIGRVDRH